MKNLYGTRYQVGTAADLLCKLSLKKYHFSLENIFTFLDPSGGGSDDWAKGKAGIKYVYCLELRPNGNSGNGFLLPTTEIVPTGEETWAGISVVAKAVIGEKKINAYEYVAQVPRNNVYVTI